MLEQFSLTWKNIHVAVFEKTRGFCKTTVKQKAVINNVSGSAKSGSLFAIMGSSGSGKTTLLGAISGRSRVKTGLLQLNDTIISDSDVKNMSGYVPQQDIFTEYLTVLEHLEFMAGLLIGDRKKSKPVINQLLSELSLEHSRFTLITNLSGGERRRLSLAGELISNPHILFCDEPTTGLDSYSATVVVQKLQTIARSGKIVLAAIHQPSSQLFHYFDNILLLAEGRLVFQGSTQEAKKFFEGFELLCPTNYNPAEFYIKCLTYEDVPKMCATFESQRKLKARKSCPHCDHVDNVFLKKRTTLNFCYELRWLLWRNYLKNKRNKMAHFGGYVLVMIEILATALFYSQVTFGDNTSVQNIQGLLTFIGSEFIFTNMYAVICVFPDELAVFLKEKTLYSSSAYFVSKVLSMIPLTFVTSIIYMGILFLILQFLDGFYLWIRMTYLMFLVGMSSCGLGFAFSATISNVEQVDLYIGAIEFVLLVMSGFMVRLDSIPVAFIWIKFLSPFYYGFDSLSNILWKTVTVVGNCTGNETIPCYNNGTEVLRNYDIYKPYDNVAYNVLYLHVLTVGFCLIGFLGLLRKKVLYSI